jgi:hypothetical protein
MGSCYKAIGCVAVKVCDFPSSGHDLSFKLNPIKQPNNKAPITAMLAINTILISSNPMSVLTG